MWQTQGLGNTPYAVGVLGKINRRTHAPKDTQGIQESC